MTPAVALLAGIFFASPLFAQTVNLESRGAELKDGTWVMSVGAGLGSPIGGAKKHFGMPYAVGGEVFYVPRPEYALGVQVDRLLFMGKGGSSGDATVITVMDRANAAMGYENYLLYGLLGLGFAEMHGSLPDGSGSDHGSGPALAVGLGFQRVGDGTFGWAVEARLLRASAGLPQLGLGGITVAVAQVKLDWKFTWAPDFFGP